MHNWVGDTAGCSDLQEAPKVKGALELLPPSPQNQGTLFPVRRLCCHTLYRCPVLGAAPAACDNVLITPCLNSDPSQSGGGQEREDLFKFGARGNEGSVARSPVLVALSARDRVLYKEKEGSFHPLGSWKARDLAAGV